jgi:crotonobetainyl-CoA:carnitine CoA-transferase CaiB-like acyl-CoA transferase
VPGDPQDVFPCAGGQWVALAAPTAAQQGALAALVGDDVGAWCAAREAADAAEELVAAGVPAGVVIHAAAVDENEQLGARGFYELLDHPVTGRQPLPSIPLRFSRRGFRWHRTPPPTLGQHNAEVLGGLLGLDDAELQRLRDDGVIGQRPVGL